MKRLVPVVLLACAGLAAVPPALAQGRAQYEPPQRQRVGALDNCMKDEVMNSAWCVKRCAEGFKMEMGKRSATCVATSAGAKVPPPPTPNYTPAKPEPGAKGA
jgi:hypothetical protein